VVGDEAGQADIGQGEGRRLKRAAHAAARGLCPRCALCGMPIYETDPGMRYAPAQVWCAASLYVAHWEQDFHALMWHDHLRMGAYEHALKRVVQPGMTGVAVGTGTGILAQGALEAGARTAHAIDMHAHRIAEARARLSRAGYAGGVRRHRGRSSEVTLPERVDVVMAERLGHLGDNEGMSPTLHDARARCLQEGGHRPPRRARALLVPVSAVALDGRCEAGGQRPSVVSQPPGLLSGRRAGRHKATRTAVLSAATVRISCMMFSLLG
jgi:hypothetical protein